MFELKIYFYNKPNKVGELSNMTADQSFVVRCLESIISIEYSMKNKHWFIFYMSGLQQKRH